MLEMKELITKKDIHLLYKDECGDDFLVTSFGEVHVKDNNTLRLYLLGPDKGLVPYRSLRSQIPLFNVNKLDDGFIECETKIENLPSLIKTSTRKQRLQKRVIPKWEKALAHKCYPIKSNKKVKS